MGVQIRLQSPTIRKFKRGLKLGIDYSGRKILMIFRPR